MNIVACIDHHLARLESAARTFLRSDLHQREARAAVERDVFDGADALADAEAEMEVHEPAAFPSCAHCDAPIEWADEGIWLHRLYEPHGFSGWRVSCGMFGESITVATPKLPTVLAASGNSPAAECEPPSPAAGHSTPLPVLLSRASMVLGLYAPEAWQPLADELQDAAYAYLRHK